MLQDLTFGKLENEYHNLNPQETDLVFCFRGKDILIRRDSSGFSVPTCGVVSAWQRDAHWTAWADNHFQYLFRFQGVNCFLWTGESGTPGDTYWVYYTVRTLRDLDGRDLCFAAMTAWHLYNWYRGNRFCGSCASPTVHDDRERMLRCPNCGNMIFPRINPAVIVAVTNGEALLLTKYAGRAYTRYALVAGFTEIGETLEQTVAREVMEEVGLHVKNIRYYKSQPWGIDGNILMGFYCDVDGDTTIHLDERELSVGEWHPRHNLPARDDGFSLTREMIRIFEEGKEPPA